MRELQEGETPELRNFREKGCTKGGVRQRGRPAGPNFTAAFAEERTCIEGHKYRGAQCKTCLWHEQGWRTQDEIDAGAAEVGVRGVDW